MNIDWGWADRLKWQGRQLATPTILLSFFCMVPSAQAAPVINCSSGFASSGACGVSIPPPPNPPPQISSYTLAFYDEFDQLDLSSNETGTHTWYPGLWYDHAFPPLSQMTDASSALSLVWQQNQTPADTSIETFAENNPAHHAWRYGYFEARMKWDVVTGAWPAFWMIPVQNAPETGELDIFEGQGASPQTYFGTVHDWDNLTGTSTANSPNFAQLPPGTDFSQYHTYGVLWVPGQVTWYFDNQALYSAPTPAIMDSQDYFLVLTMQAGANWQLGNLSGVTVSSMTLNVDWVHVWQAPARSSPPTTPTNPPPTTAFVSALKVYPNPWRSTKDGAFGMTFDGLTVGTTIKIFTVSAHEVKELHTDGAKIVWDLTNDLGDKVASGIYLYVITDGQGDKVRGKVAVIK